MKNLWLGLVFSLWFTAGTLSAQEEATNNTEGELGDSNWAALYEAYAQAWNTDEGNEYASQQLNRYDLVLFGKKYSKVAGQRATCEKTGWGKPKITTKIEVLGNQIKLSANYSQTFTLLELTAQLWAGSVPVLIKVAAAASFSAGANETLGDTFTGEAHGMGGIGVSLTAAVGFSMGYVGIEGSLNLLEAYLWLFTQHNGQTFTAKSGFELRSTGKVSLVAKLGPFYKTYPIWEPPAKKYIDLTLLDITLN